MNFKIDSNAANIGVAIHAVVGCAETHNLIRASLNNPLIDTLSAALGGAIVPRLVYKVDHVANENGFKTFERIENEGVDNDFDVDAKGYANVQPFYEFAETLYLINVAYAVISQINKVPNDADKSVIQELVDACVEKSAEDIIRGSRVLNVDGKAFAQVASIQCEENPLPYLAPIFNMLNTLGENYVVAGIRKDFGERALEKWANFISESYTYLLRVTPDFKQADIHYNYVF